MLTNLIVQRVKEAIQVHFQYHEKTVLTESETVNLITRRLVLKKNCFSVWASTLNMGLINKVDMVCLSLVGYGV